MVKRNKLYTVNKWNKNLFVVGGNTNGVNYSGQNTVVRNPFLPIETVQVNDGTVFFNDYNKRSSSLAPVQGLATYIQPETVEISVGSPQENVDYVDSQPNNDGLSGNKTTNTLLQNTGSAAQTLLPSILKGSATGAGTALATNTAGNTMLNLGTQLGGASTYAGREALKLGVQQLSTDFSKSAADIISNTGKSYAENLAEKALSSGAGSAVKTGFSNALGAGNLSAAEGAAIGIAASTVGGIGKHYISDGFSTKTGNNIATIGNLAGGVVGAINPVIGGIVTLAGNVIGGVVNRGWGHSVYGKANAQNYLNNMSGFKVGGSNNDIENAMSNITEADKVTYKDGWFTNKGKKEARSWNNKTAAAYDYALRSVDNAAQNNIISQNQKMLANYAALGGPIESATDYGFMSDWLTTKNKDIENKNKMSSVPNSFIGGNDNMFAIGGTLQSHGSNWDNGVTTINAGGSHEQNPHEGVQLSTDSEGTPNMVEEGEAVWNDFVFSNRINVPKAIRQQYGLRGKKDITFADAAKKLQKESEERPNDSISAAGLDASLEALANAQEELKMKDEKLKMQEEFAKLSPEQQRQVMQELAARQQAAQQQAVAQQQQQVSPEQQQMLEQQAMQQQQMQPNVSAMGGNLYGDGGVLALLKTLGFKSTAEAEKAGFTPQDFGVDSWTKMNNSTALPKDFKWNTDWNSRLGKELQARMSLGWSPLSELVQPTWYEPTGGNRVGWSASVPLTNLDAEQYADALKRYANTLGYADKQGWIKAPGEGQTISTKDLQAAMMRTPDWIATDKWLYDDTNARANQEEYLGKARSYNDPDDQKFIDKWSKYGDFTTEDGKNYKFKLRDGLSADDYNKFLEQFKKSRNDEFLGVMHNSKTTVPETQVNYQYDPQTGKVVGVLTDTTGYHALGDRFTWGDTDTNRSAQFYITKEAADAMNTANAGSGTAGNGTGNGDLNGELVPIHKNEKLRYVGLMGPAIGLGLQAMGVGKPDTSALDAAVSASGVNPIAAAVEPIGNRLVYKPLDTDYETNKLASMAGASRRAILNSGSTPSRGAAILAADNQYMGKVGDLYRAAVESNQAQKEKVATFNRGTDQFNAEAFNRAALQYVSDYNRQKQFNAQMQMEAARQKMDAQAGWYNSLYGNIGQLAAGIGNLGKENAQHNMIADMAAQGLFGAIDPNSPMGSRVVRYAQNKTNKSSRGGKLNRRRKGGLTY